MTRPQWERQFAANTLGDLNLKKLERHLGLWPVVMISVSAMLGSGVFVLPGLAVGQTGGSTYLAYLVCALCVLPAALAKAELASAMPYSGGTYNYILKAFGPLMGTTMGLGLWASLLLKSCFALIGIGAYLRVLGEGIPVIPVALAMLGVITLLNLMGVKKVSKFQSVVVAISLVGLLTVCVLAVPSLKSDNFDPFFTNGPQGFFETVAFLFVAFAGVTKVAAIAGEVKNPGVTLPRAMVITMAIITPIYCVVAYVLAGNLDPSALGQDIRPIYSLAVKLGGPVLGYAAAVVAVLTMMSMSNAGLLASSRFPFAMGRDSLLPPALAHLDHKHLIPTRCILLTSGAMALVIVFVDIAQIVKLASAFKILAFMANEISLIIMRTSAPQWYKPAYRAPLFPGLQICAATVMFALLIAIGLPALMCILLGFGVGGLLYFFYGRHRMKDKGMLGKIGLRFDLTAPPPTIFDPKEAYAREFDSSVGHHTAVVALTGAERSVEMLILVGAALSNKQRIEAVHLTEVPDQLGLDEVFDEDADVISIHRRVLGMREMAKLDIRFEPMVSHDVIETVHGIALERQCEWMVMKWRPYRFFNPLGWLYNHLPTDLALYRDRGIRYIRRIVVLAEPGPLDAVLAESAGNLSSFFGSTLTFAAFVPKSARERSVRQTEYHLQEMRRCVEGKSEQVLFRGNHEIDTITEATKSYDLLVLAARPHSNIGNIFLKTTECQITDRAVCSVVFIKSPRVNAPMCPVKSAHFDIEEHLQESLIGIGLEVASKADLFERMAERFLLACPTAQKSQVVRALMNREASQDTGVCHGVAMPHATLPSLDGIFLMVEVLASPLDYDAPDNQPVDVVFATLGPPSHREIHLNLLGGLSRMVLEKGFLDGLRTKTSATEILEWISKAPDETRYPT